MKQTYLRLSVMICLGMSEMAGLKHNKKPKTHKVI